jgi:hypothetical protein
MRRCQVQLRSPPLCSLRRVQSWYLVCEADGRRRRHGQIHGPIRVRDGWWCCAHPFWYCRTTAADYATESEGLHRTTRMASDSLLWGWGLSMAGGIVATKGCAYESWMGQGYVRVVPARACVRCVVWWARPWVVRTSTCSGFASPGRTNRHVRLGDSARRELSRDRVRSWHLRYSPRTDWSVRAIHTCVRVSRTILLSSRHPTSLVLLVFFCREKEMVLLLPNYRKAPKETGNYKQVLL